MRGRISATLAVAVLIGTAGSAPANAAETGGMAFVHVEANVGGASGGHSALRVGDRVYHYQLGDERLLDLDRVEWDVFRFRYNILQNRPLKLAHLDVGAETQRTVSDGFTSVLLQQRRERAELAELERDVALLETTLGLREGVPTPGAGLFDPDGLPPAGALAVAERLRTALGGHPAQPPTELGSTPDAAQRYREALALHFAVRMVREARPLAPGAWLAPDGPPLQSRERSALRGLQAGLEQAMARLLTDRARPDRSRPLLVALARHRAAQRSLDSGRLHLVDPFPAQAPGLDAREAQRRRAELSAIADFLDERVSRERDGLLDRDAPHEHDLARLEALAARAREYRRGADEGHPVREPGDVLVPQRSRDLPAPAPASPHAETRLAALHEQRNALTAARHARWRYDLIGRDGENCVTQLALTLSTALEDPSDALGGRLDPDAPFNFWPLVFFRDVEEKLTVSRIEALPAHRLRLRAELDSRDGRLAGRLATRLRESNTVTSAVYTPRAPDGSFLFFTDDLVWTRPLLGALNVAWAASDGLLGLVTAPFDRGRRLVRAGHGAFFSLPELFFVNIRKGTFDAATLPASPSDD